MLQVLVLEIILWVEGSHSLGGFDEEPGQVEQGSGEGLEEGLGGIGTEPGQVQQGCGEGSGEESRTSGRLWCRARSDSTICVFAAIELTESHLTCFQRLVWQHASEKL